MEKLISNSQNKIKETSQKFHRYLFHEIDWDDRLVGITGARGVGKTTMLLQYIKQRYSMSPNALYITLDDLYFTKNSLFETVETLYLNGLKHIFIDEVHKYQDWSIEIKNLYDTFSGLKIVFSGSSALSIHKAKADLSRRAAMYHLHELSFREYLVLSDVAEFQPMKLDDIVKEHIEASITISESIKPIYHFNNYLNQGVYPFFKEVKSKYHDRLLNVIQVILENDLVALENLNYTTVFKLKKILAFIAESVPFKPNISELSIKVGVSRDFLVKLLYLLNDASIIIMARQAGSPSGIMNKPEKIYLENTNLLQALNIHKEAERGTIRETFFINQLIQNHKIEIPKAGDFLVDESYQFEIGGKNKTMKQLGGIKDSFLALDNIEFGFKKSIPLWLFGFLY